MEFNPNLIEKHKRKSLRYLKQLKAIMEARETKEKSLHFRNKILERQQAANYQNELDRLRGALTQREIKNLTDGAFKNRINNLSRVIAEIKK